VLVVKGDRNLTVSILGWPIRISMSNKYEESNPIEETPINTVESTIVDDTPIMHFYCLKGPVAEKLSVVLLGVGFMFLFSAFSTTQNYSTQLFYSSVSE
jgi:hypothetical protein